MTTILTIKGIKHLETLLEEHGPETVKAKCPDWKTHTDLAMQRIEKQADACKKQYRQSLKNQRKHANNQKLHHYYTERAKYWDYLHLDYLELSNQIRKFKAKMLRATGEIK